MLQIILNKYSLLCFCLLKEPNFLLCGNSKQRLYYSFCSVKTFAYINKPSTEPQAPTDKHREKPEMQKWIHLRQLGRMIASRLYHQKESFCVRWWCFNHDHKLLFIIFSFVFKVGYGFKYTLSGISKESLKQKFFLIFLIFNDVYLFLHRRII